MDLDAALQAGRLADIAAVLDSQELQSDSPDDPLLPPWPAAAHMLAHMLNGNLDDARFVYKRLPPASQASPGVASSLTLLRALWSHDLPAAWAALAGGDWPPGAPAALASALSTSLRATAADAVGRLYSRLPLARAAAVLGVEERGVGGVAAEHGWVVEGGVVTLPEPSADGDCAAAALLDGVAAASVPGEDELKTLAEYVLQLESSTT